MRPEDQRPETEERYTTAIQASNLRVKADKAGSADVLIAAGWSRSRLGAHLMRLHSEWDSAAKPLHPAIADKAKAAGWYEHEAKLLMGQLKMLPDVRDAVTAQAERWLVADPAGVSAAILHHWLNPTCPECKGRRYKLIAGTPKLSGSACPRCHGSGSKPIPGKEDGRKMLGYIDDCIAVARTSISQRLRTHHKGA